MFPEFIMPGSFDPMHQGHLRTFRIAKKRYPKLCILIYQNKSKKAPLFSLEERVKIAQLYLHPRQVFVAHSSNEVVAFLLKATKVVWGYRDNDDIQGIIHRAIGNRATQFLEKLFPVHIEQPFSEMSSSKLRGLVASGQYKEEMDWVPTAVVEMIQAKTSVGDC